MPGSMGVKSLRFPAGPAHPNFASLGIDGNASRPEHDALPVQAVGSAGAEAGGRASVVKIGSTGSQKVMRNASAGGQQVVKIGSTGSQKVMRTASAGGQQVGKTASNASPETLKTASTSSHEPKKVVSVEVEDDKGDTDGASTSKARGTVQQQPRGTLIRQFTGGLGRKSTVQFRSRLTQGGGNGAITAGKLHRGGTAAMLNRSGTNGLAVRYGDMGLSGPATFIPVDYDDDDDDEEVEEEGVPFMKRLITTIIMSQAFEMFAGFVIVMNFVSIVLETDSRAVQVETAPGSARYAEAGEMLSLMYIANIVFLVFYCSECMCRCYIMGWHFFLNAWDRFDLVIVTIGVVTEIVESAYDGSSAEQLAPLRALRNVRLLRVSRLLISFQELHSLICGLTYCMKTLMWAAGLIFMMLTMWSIIAVENLHPMMAALEAEGHYETCAWCPHAFENIIKANLTLFQIISGDGWSLLCRPLIEKHPWAALIIVAVIFTMLFGLLNLVTAVIVDTAAQSHGEDIVKIAEAKECDRRRAWKCFSGLCDMLDVDNNGDIDFLELRQGIDEIPELAAYISSMGMEEDDISQLMQMLDYDGDGVISHIEFATRLYKMKTQDERTGICILRHMVEDLRKKCTEILLLNQTQIATANLEGAVVSPVHATSNNSVGLNHSVGLSSVESSKAFRGADSRAVARSRPKKEAVSADAGQLEPLNALEDTNGHDEAHIQSSSAIVGAVGDGSEPGLLLGSKDGKTNIGDDSSEARSKSAQVMVDCKLDSSKVASADGPVDRRKPIKTQQAPPNLLFLNCDEDLDKEEADDERGSHIAQASHPTACTVEAPAIDVCSSLIHAVQEEALGEKKSSPRVEEVPTVVIPPSDPVPHDVRPPPTMKCEVVEQNAEAQAAMNAPAAPVKKGCLKGSAGHSPRAAPHRKQPVVNTGAEFSTIVGGVAEDAPDVACSGAERPVKGCLRKPNSSK